MLFLENFPLFYGNNLLQLYNKDLSVQRNLPKKHRALQRCEFKPIPSPTRVPDLHEKIYHLYGDVVLMEKAGRLVAEVSLINNFKTFKDVQVTKCQNEKLITVYPQKKREFNPHRWVDLVRRLNEIGSEEALEWSQIVHDFCIQSQKAIDLCVNGKNLIKEQEKKTLEGITAWSTEKKAKIIANHPCIMLKTCLNQSGFGLSEISVNEKFLIEAGYSVETYSSLVLEEGLRQFMPFNDRLACGAMKLLMRDCFDFSHELMKPKDLDNFLLMKSGYVKKVKTQVHFLPSYQNESFEIIRVISIVDKGVPYLEGITPSPAIVTPDFWESMVQKEHDLKYFLGNYYDKTAAMRYTNINKICRIRELKKPAIKTGPKPSKTHKQHSKQKALENGDQEELD